MKHFLRDILIVIIQYSGLALLYRKWHQRRGSLVRVLCFHDVPDRLWFESVVAMLQAEYYILTPEEFHAKKFHANKINVLLTFDDGYKSWIDVVLPILQNHQLYGLFFISSGLLDTAEVGGDQAAKFIKENLRLTTTRRLLTWTGARQLVAAGHTIGGHTVSHVSLASIEVEAVIEAEVKRDKQRLETKLETTLIDFAYPFGRKKDIDQFSVACVKNANYNYQFLAQTGWYRHDEKDKSLAICRTLLDQKLTPKQIRVWMNGSYDIFNSSDF